MHIGRSLYISFHDILSKGRPRLLICSVSPDPFSRRISKAPGLHSSDNSTDSSFLPGRLSIRDYISAFFKMGAYTGRDNVLL